MSPRSCRLGSQGLTAAQGKQGAEGRAYAATP
jgi:hypothetical protein